jgi:hypothetical protein
MSLIHWWNSRRNAKLEQELTREQKVNLDFPADFKYPPPSAYEVKQINEEYGLDKVFCLERIPPMKQWRLQVDIDKLRTK